MRDRYNLNLLPGMSEDGMEYGEPQEDKRPARVCGLVLIPSVSHSVSVFQTTWT